MENENNYKWNMSIGNLVVITFFLKEKPTYFQIEKLKKEIDKLAKELNKR